MSGGAGALLAVGWDGLAVPDDVAALAERDGLGGAVLFARNCPDLETVLRLTAAARALGPDVLVLVDHEGGRVHRLPPPFTRFPAAAVVGRARDPALAARVARAMARELRAAGFDSGLGPVLDCLLDPAGTAIGDRAWGSDPDLVAACGVAFVQAALAEGLLPVVKHFPGHGRTPLDSHLALPDVDVPPVELARVELLPFRRALEAGCPAVMVAHVRYPALDRESPASLSPAAIGALLRAGLAFDGLVLSDDLEMRAVADRWGPAQAAVRFLAAGGDLALICRDPAARAAAAAAVARALEDGTIPRASLAAAVRRRRAARQLVERAGPPPGPEVIGCAEHRELVAEIRRRAEEAPA